MLRKTSTILTIGLAVIATFVGPQLSAQEAGVGQLAAPKQFSGGVAKAIIAKTQTASQILSESASWATVSGASLTYVVPAGSSDIVNVAFSAECRIPGGASEDYLLIRVMDTVNGASTPFDPSEARAFCSVDSNATHTGNWVKIAGPGTHTLQVQVRIFDGPPANILQAWLDDWTLQLVVYE